MDDYKQKYAKFDSDGHFAGCVIRGGHEDSVVDKWIEEGAVAITTEEHELYCTGSYIRGADGKPQEYVYVPTEAEKLETLKNEKLTELKSFLTETDYKFREYQDGYITQDDYDAIKVLANAWRDAYNTIQNATTIDAVNAITYEKYEKSA